MLVECDLVYTFTYTKEKLITLDSVILLINIMIY